MLDFEKSFGDFIDRREYDHAENALFPMVRIAYTAGWLAAGGNAPNPQKVIQMARPYRVLPLKAHEDNIETDIDLDKNDK